MWTLTDAAPTGMSMFDFPASAGQVVSGAFDEALETNPVPLFMMSRELHGAKSIGPRLEKADAEAEAERRGVKMKIPEDGITKQALDILVERRRDDAARSLLYARREGFLAGAGMFSAGVAGALMDPLNAATGFVPVLSGTRYAATLAKAATVSSRAGVRLGIGAAEGAVGAALVELPTSALRRDLEDDYGLYDSLANVAFGTFASMGIRAGSGALRDKWSGIKAARQQDFLRSIEPEERASAQRAYENQIEQQMDSELRGGFDVGESRLRMQELDQAVDVTPRLKELGAKIKQLGTMREGGGLTADEAAQYKAATRERSELLYDSGRLQAGTPKDVEAAAKRMSTLSPETNNTIRGDVIRDRNIFLALDEATAGVHYNADTAVDKIMLGQNPKVSAQQLYDNFQATREALRAQYGDTITLWRAEGKQKEKPTKNWATTKEFAAEFGKNVVSREFSIDQIVAANVSKRGTYHELIVGERPMVSDATHAQALKTAVAQAASGQRINVDPVLRQDHTFGAQRMALGEVRTVAESSNAPENKSAASPEASAKADAQLKAEAPASDSGRAEPPPPRGTPGEGAGVEAPKDPELTALEAKLAEAKAVYDAALKDAGLEPPKPKEGERDSMQRAQDYERGLAAFADCVKKG